MHLTIINGPNLNLLGTRETSIYGDMSFEKYLDELRRSYPSLRLDYFQSNVEGELVTQIHQVGFGTDGIILNAAAYSHNSIAIADAVAAVDVPVIEVHISNVFAREEFRHISLPARYCAGMISGFGLDSYRLAVEAFVKKIAVK